MIINNLSRVYGAYQQNNTKATSRASKSEEKKDLVALSSQAKDYQAVKKALENVPNIRQDKIDELSKKINSGNYRVNAEAIADKIINDYFA